MSEYIWKKKEVAAENCARPEIVKRVLVLYTGGTVGMKWSEKNGYQPAHNYLEQKIKSFPSLYDSSYEKHWPDCDSFSPLPLPCTFKGYRILYSIIEYDPLLDSSNLSMEDWATIAVDISTHYHHFNGFVILHGTDTMSYTASALSFMCENLGKTIILTGSQIPLSELRNDARDNILGSLILAGQYVIPEVCIFFHNKLYRGNRATKLNSASLEAFSSPNLPPLAVMGVDISVEWDAIHRPMETKKFAVFSGMDRNVGILRIFPGITQETVRSFLQPPMKGVILQTYGAGNIPDKPYLFDELKAACDRGVIVVNCTQCSSGVVTDMYSGGIKLRQVGVVSGRDMTTEASLAKLSFLLAKGYGKEMIRDMMQQNLHGELTTLNSDQHQFLLGDSELLSAIVRALNISSNKEVKMLRQTFFPPLMCAAASTGDIESLQVLHCQGGDYNFPDYDGRTPLHLACCEGHLKTVHYLLEHGASVHASDRYNHTPLHNACRFKHKEVVQLLLETGADFSSDCREELECKDPLTSSQNR